MPSDRDVLEDLLLNARVDGKTTDETADDILDAGWRPPARVVADGGEVEAIAVEWMRHVGFTAEEIAEAEAHSCIDTCERVGDAWDCTDEDGESRHPIADDLAAAADMANVAMETIEARGWRPPARVITDPAEADALPMGSVALVPTGVAHTDVMPWTRSRSGWWAGGSVCTSEYLIRWRGPLTLIHVPIEETTRD